MTLDELNIGQSGTILSVGGEGALRRRFLDMGLTPKTRVMVRKRAPLGDPIELCLRGYELTIRREDASKIIVRPAEGGCGRGCGHWMYCQAESCEGCKEREEAGGKEK